MPQSCLYEGKVMHCRLQPVHHRFVYRVFSLLLDIDEIGVLGTQLRLFSYNRFNLFSFHDSDHGARDGSALKPWVEGELRGRGIELSGGRVFLHALPRLLGYTFNPLSIYWCYDASGTLRALLCEVKNTFGGQHTYCLPVAAGHAPDKAVRHLAAKVFYVSPFIPMTADYRFTVHAPEESLSIAIRESVPEGELLIATHIGRRAPLHDAALLRAFIIFPFVTLKIIAAIHWQALCLWLKGVRLHRHPAMPPLSIQSPGE